MREPATRGRLSRDRFLTGCSWGCSSLCLDACGLLRVPPEIGGLRDLVTLNLSYNLLDELPDEICELPALTSLYINNNRIAALPVSSNLEFTGGLRRSLPIDCLCLQENIGALAKTLEFIYADNNRLAAMPASIEQVKPSSAVACGDQAVSDRLFVLQGAAQAADVVAAGQPYTEAPQGDEGTEASGECQDAGAGGGGRSLVGPVKGRPPVLSAGAGAKQQLRLESPPVVDISPQICEWRPET